VEATRSTDRLAPRSFFADLGDLDDFADLDDPDDDGDGVAAGVRAPGALDPGEVLPGDRAGAVAIDLLRLRRAAAAASGGANAVAARTHITTR